MVVLLILTRLSLHDSTLLITSSLLSKQCLTGDGFNAIMGPIGSLQLKIVA